MKPIFILALLAMISGCTTPPEFQIFDNSRTYNKSHEETWQQLSTFFNTSSIPVVTKDKQKGIIRAQRKLKRGSIYADCGTSDIGSVQNGTLTVKIKLRSLARRKTQATVDVTFSAYRHYVGVAKKQIECFSNGTLEREILKNL